MAEAARPARYAGIHEHAGTRSSSQADGLPDCDEAIVTSSIVGIVGLWEVTGKGEVHRIEDYAAAHWERHKRPLRIAVDEACWRFNNITHEQVQRIQEGEPAANPIEKVILRIAKDRWASKGSGRRGGKIDPKCIKMLHQLFDRLKVPYHSAPGEAEAECARLQVEGVVDAVWSDDSDCLMFGCTKLIKAHRDNEESTTPSGSQSAPTCTQRSSGASRARKQPSVAKVAAETEILEPQPAKPAKKGARKDDEQMETSRPVKKTRKPKAYTKARSASPPPATFRRVAMPDFDALRRSVSQVIDLGEDDSEDDLPTPRSPGLFVSPYRQPPTPSARKSLNPSADLGLEQRTHDRRNVRGVHETSSSATLQTSETFRSQTTNRVVDTKNMPILSRRNSRASPERTFMAKSNTSQENLIPGGVAIAATLRERREMGLLSKLPTRSREANHQMKPVQRPQCEVIDLT
ncbi:putative XPG/Rad2 endonuclease, XPG-I domain, PIN-like domain superfamily [Septoria linicola]|nr:putative XPG/Rad2 endonuclease, XPG-I domain, PIN-like domain superfamily [Septoria linicola]